MSTLHFSPESRTDSTAYVPDRNTESATDSGYCQRISVYLWGVVSYLSAKISLLANSLFLCLRLNRSHVATAASSFVETAATSRIDTSGFRSPLLDFYRGNAANSDNFTRDEFLAWDDTQLINPTRYSCWMFPLETPSPSNPNAPLLNAETILAFKNEPLLKNNLLAAFKRMLTFYGMILDERTIQIHPAANAHYRQSVWLIPNNVHFKTITRILWSLKTLGLVEHARSFKTALEDVYGSEGSGIITANMMQSWNRPFLASSRSS